MRSGWKKKYILKKQFHMSLDKILLVFLLAAVLLFASPEVVFSLDIKITDSIAMLRHNESFFSVDLQTDVTEIQINENDRQTRLGIAGDIHDTSFIEFRTISVTVKNDVATLRDTAKNLLENASAKADAFQGGADEVRNYLKIRDPPIIRSRK